MTQQLGKMMVVEDMPYQREAMVALLSCMSDEKIYSAENGRIASEILKQNHHEIDVIFTDLQMPEMDGLELLEFLGDIRFKGCVFICSYMEQKVIDLAIELARRKSIHLVGCLDKLLSESILLAMFERVKAVKSHYATNDHLLSEDELKECLAQKNVVPFYQPQIDQKTLKVKGFEALSRLTLPGSQRILTPDFFIPVANKFKLANLLTITLIERSIIDFKKIAQASGYKELDLSINICPSQLDDDEMPNTLSELCQELDFAPEHLIIEITESDVIETDKRLKNLNRLRLLGFGCSLDDFGMGFTSIRQIHNYPFTEVKMDKSLVQGIEQDLYAQRLYDKLYALTREKGLELIIEGIETAEQANYFAKYNDVFSQGFLVSRPKPADEIKVWYESWLKQHQFKHAEN